MAATCKLSLLDLGRLDVDDGWFIRGATSALESNPHPALDRRRVAVVSAVVEHPTAGPILFDTGCAQNARDEWPEPAWEAFPRNVANEATWWVRVPSLTRARDTARAPSPTRSSTSTCQRPGYSRFRRTSSPGLKFSPVWV